MQKFVFAACAALMASIAPAGAQPGGIYKIEYRIRDASEAAPKIRRYSMLLDGTGHGTLRVGDRVPVATGSFQPGTGGAGINPLVNTQFTYLDLGVNIDTKLKPQEDNVALVATLDLSTMVEHKQPAGSGTLPNPTVAQIKINIDTVVTPGKPTVLASIDDPVTQHKLDVEAVVTKQ